MPPAFTDSQYADLVTRVAAVISVKADQLPPETVLADLGLDSMTTVELMVDLQEDYEVLLTRDDFVGVTTIADLAGLIFGKLAEQRAS